MGCSRYLGLTIGHCPAVFDLKVGKHDCSNNHSENDVMSKVFFYTYIITCMNAVMDHQLSSYNFLLLTFLFIFSFIYSHLSILVNRDKLEDETGEP